MGAARLLTAPPPPPQGGHEVCLPGKQQGDEGGTCGPSHLSYALAVLWVLSWSQADASPALRGLQSQWERGPNQRKD